MANFRAGVNRVALRLQRLLYSLQTTRIRRHSCCGANSAALVRALGSTEVPQSTTFRARNGSSALQLLRGKKTLV
jgi:hypothetical protein